MTKARSCVVAAVRAYKAKCLVGRHASGRAVNEEVCVCRREATMARAPNTAPLAGLAGHVSRTAARVISRSGQAAMDAEAWEAVSGAEP
eukprot:scaffold22586_cov146-Isochrysis_galbana.AAC.1